ncbi:MAG: HlyD family efflux transporter periplasmic adaptor subunit [Magnetococcales bacterium]|nr:HlyD family efflux transporter periplasmic adaptor subunit [Magnetococcales bacterium]
MSPPTATAVLPLLLGLMQRARQAQSLPELRFILVNETHALFGYQQAILWDQEGAVSALSGVAQVEAQAPYVLWLRRLFQEQVAPLNAPCPLQADAVSPALQQEWQEWLPPSLLLLPLLTPDQQRIAALALAREEPWSRAEQQLLQELAGSYALALAWWQRPQLATLLAKSRRTLRRQWWLWLGLLLLLTLLPIRLSVLAPAELVARDPAVVRAPLDGIVDRILVSPNQTVRAGDLLLEMETSTLRSKLEVANKALTTSQAEYERSAQQGFSDGKAKAQLGVIAGRIEERQAEVVMLAEQLQRSQVKAARHGRVVLDNPDEWQGRAVSVGERLLAIADEQDTEIEAWLAPADRIPLPEAAAVTLFLHVDPLHPIAARLRYLTFATINKNDGSAAYRLRADISQKTAQQLLGLKGTVRVDGYPVSLGYWLLRRPWAMIRSFLGV